ncbi:septum site-determining protein MinC [Methylocystis echinoides]|uniref:septum site-determining protein MinC n=1 Tax=Methylocystis echinoides TaxID=29468 RepID=UPI00342525DE
MNEFAVTQTASRHIRFRGRSYPTLALELEAPLADWMARLDAYLACSPAFFAKKPIVIDVARLELDRSSLVQLLQELTQRGIRILGIAGVDPSWAADDLPPILTGGRAASAPDGDEPKKKAELTVEERAAFEQIAGALAASRDPTEGQEKPAAATPDQGPVTPLVVDAPVRSGQTIFHPQGDVIVIGSVSSGADVIAGGSIHVYGTLRGRAMAGAYGEMSARIFCRRLEAELLAVGGVYLTADEIDKDMLSQNVQIWLDSEDVKVARLD